MLTKLTLTKEGLMGKSSMNGPFSMARTRGYRFA
jgi:hypothetical protein